jgi:uncharacterized protein (DUF885 family)
LIVPWSFRLTVVAGLVVASVGCAARREPAATADGPSTQPPAAAGEPARPAVTDAPDDAGSRWDAFVEDYITATFTVRPDRGVSAGRHEFDGKLPDWSPEGLAANSRMLREHRDRARAFDPDSLDERRRFEREYLLAQVGGALFWLETAEWPHRNPYWYAGALDPQRYVVREYAPPAERLRAYVAFARAVPRAAAQIRANLRTPLPRTYVAIGRTSLGGLASYYEEDVPALFAGVKDDALQADFQEANAGAVRALRELDAWLESLEPSATDDFAMGPELFRAMLRETEGVDVPLEKLADIARRDLDRNLASMGEACSAYAPGATVEECVARVKASKPQEGPVAAARRQLGDLKAFLVDQDLVTIPGPEEAEVEQAPPYRAWNTAYIEIPGPYEKGLPSVYYISPPDPDWPEAERLAYLPGEADLLSISVHEVWPGHFLHFLHSHRAPSAFGRVFVGYAFGEGWAHYAEEMMWEAGLGDGDPEVHIGQLLWALTRNVRFVCAIGLHTRGMSVAECEWAFRDEAYLDPGNARQQAARGTFDPAYLNYTMGKLMVLKLRADWTASRGGRAAWKAFHDEFLSYGGPPIPLVRRAMLGSDGSGLF